MLNEGYIEKLKKKWLTNTLKCPKIEGKADGVPVEHIAGVFGMIFVGMAAVILVLIYEIIWFKCAARKRKNQNKTFEFGEIGTNVNKISHVSHGSHSSSVIRRPKISRTRRLRSQSISHIGVTTTNSFN